jgi:hypothetical protein
MALIAIHSINTAAMPLRDDGPASAAQTGGARDAHAPGLEEAPMLKHR